MTPGSPNLDYLTSAGNPRPLTESSAKSLPGAAVAVSQPPVSEGAECWFYRRGWTQSEIAVTASLETTTWMIFMDPLGLGKQISVQLSGAEHRVIEVSPGKSFARVGKDRYRIRPGNRADYDALFADITKRGSLPRKIVHLWSVSGGSLQPSVDETLNLSFYSLLNLAQRLGHQGISGVDIAVVSNHLQSVSGEPIAEPLRATLLGPTKVIPKEFPGITCRSIDCDPAGQGTSYAAVQIITELSAPFCDSVVAYRRDRRWIETLEQMEIPERAAKHSRLKKGGAYLITGGLDDLGLAVAENLARDFQARLVLLDRIALPPSGEWQERLQSSATPGRTKQVISKLVEIESLGGVVMTVCADVTRGDEMRRAIRHARQAFGTIDGVIHAAETVEDNSLEIKTHESAARVLDPKIKGTLVLEDVLSETPLDFLALFSSVSSLIPRAGQIDYAAANAFLDAFAASRRDRRVVAINWGPWRDLGMMRRTPSAPIKPIRGAARRVSAQKDILEPEQDCGISHRQGAEALAQILSGDIPPVLVVSASDLLAKSAPSTVATERAAGTATSKEDVEGILVAWWQNLLGLEQVSRDDDFFDLGGDSMIGTQLFSRIKNTYELDLGLSTLFEARTIGQLAQLIRQKSQKSKLSREEPRPWSPLVGIQPKGTRLPIYVISGLGGNVIEFHNLAFNLGEDQPMYGFVPRGLDGKDPYHTRVEDMAADYVKAIRSTQPEGPYHLLGYSFGGIVAFEVARQIVAQGGHVGLLGLLDTIEWHYMERVFVERDSFQVMSRHLEAFVRPERGVDRISYFKELLDAKFSRIKYRLFHALGRALPQKIASIEEMNSYAAVNYHPEVYPGKLTLFRSTQRVAQEGNDQLLGWGELASGGVQVHHVPSTHFSILKEPGVQVLAEKLRSRLDDK
jgi:thioesterase domain-containing protein/NAD(P)-dependent dehydrogenase (short-subunit alcohol dehydrogenase family)/acyl carrier protein